MERSTDELLHLLQSKRSYNDFFQEAVEDLHFSSLADYLELLLNEKALKKSDVIQRSNLDRNYAYQLFNGTKLHPSRDKLLLLAFGMQLSLAETRRLLKLAGQSDLYARAPRDSILIFCLSKQKNVIETNEMLDAYGLDIME